MTARAEVLLLGGGHAHAVALRRLARRPCPALRLTLLTADRHSLYSGMLPGVIRGDYRVEQARIDCARLAERAGAQLLLGEARSLDLAERTVRLADGRRRGFDLLSLDLGGRSEPVPGAIAVRPIGKLLARIAALDGGAAPVAVVGSGPAGVELVLALARRWPGRRLILVTRDAAPLPTAPEPARRHAAAALARAGIAVAAGREAVGFAHGRVALADGHSIVACAALWATGAVGPAMLRDSGLALDALGCARTDAALRSVSHPFVLAAGDCAACDAFPRPKGGVWAVRAGRPLAEALRALAERREPAGTPLRPHAATMLGLGQGRAIGWRGRLAWSGRLAWWWKDRIDRAWIRRFQ